MFQFFGRVKTPKNQEPTKSLRIIFLTCLLSPAVNCPTALAAELQQEPKPVVSQPIGQSAVFLGGGSAVTTDLSALDHNPAGISIGKILSVEGGTAWKKENIQSTEVGIIDSLMASVAAGLKYRQTSKAVGQVERRFTLGLADDISDSGFLVGVAADYKERPDTNAEGKVTGEGQYYEVRGGMVYNFNNNIRVGVRTGGHFDEKLEQEHAVGFGALISSHFVVNGDVIFTEQDPTKAAVGLGVLFQKYFDIRVSYGYLIQTETQQAAAGFFLVSPKASLFYLASADDIDNPLLEHQLGVRMSLAL